MSYLPPQVEEGVEVMILYVMGRALSSPVRILIESKAKISIH